MPRSGLVQLPLSAYTLGLTNAQELSEGLGFSTRLELCRVVSIFPNLGQPPSKPEADIPAIGRPSAERKLLQSPELLSKRHSIQVTRVGPMFRFQGNCGARRGGSRAYAGNRRYPYVFASS